MKDSLPVAVDAMGGDHAPRVIVDGAARAVRAGYRVVLVGNEREVVPLLPPDLVIPVRHAPDRVVDGEAPATAVRRKAGASIRVAVEAVAAGEALAVVSCGSTGALMASAVLSLGRIEGIERPAIATVLPRIDGGKFVLLDLGANVDCKPRHLAQFARMGAAFATTVLGIEAPRVGLLSNGEEDGKGNEQTKAAHELIAALPLAFAGNVEPNHAFRGACDVLVCDGFVGNVMLKTLEGTAQVIGSFLKEELLRERSARLGAWLLQGPLRRLRARTDYASIGGAALLGVKGVVVAAHGRSDATAVSNAIALAHRAARADVPGSIERALASSPSGTLAATGGRDMEPAD